MARLGHAQVLALETLARVHKDDSPPTAREIVETYALRNRWVSFRRTAETEACQGALARLRKHGFVERLGKSGSNAWCWKITDAGREALAEARAS